MKGVRITIGELERLVERLKNNFEHGCMTSYVIVKEKKRHDGKKYIQFEQPCCYAECNGRFEIFDAEEK